MKAIRSLLLAGLLGSAWPAVAGPAGQALSACLERSATATDRQVLARWVFGAVARNPDLVPLTQIGDKRARELAAGAARVYERLLTEDCRREAQQAVQQEGPESIAASLRVMGQLGARELFGHPQVSGNLQGLGEHLDRKKLALVFPK